MNPELKRSGIWCLGWRMFKKRIENVAEEFD